MAAANERTGVLRGAGKVNVKGDIVLGLGGGLEHRAVDLLQVLSTTKLEELRSS
jgi:hypothetical protein